LAETTPLVVILTGGIASGKTAVSDRFARRGVPVIDTDLIAREVVAPGEPALAAIAAVFGADVIGPDGQLDRRRVRATIFSDPDKKHQLEALLHPLIRQRVAQSITAVTAPYCVLVVPLLAETGFYADARHRVLVVDVDEPTQLERVMARDHIDQAQAQAILNAQASRQQRLALADDVITNNGALEELDPAVAALDARYRQQAS